MSDTPINLDDLRQRIDQLDGDILRLISERASCAQQVAHVKLAQDQDAVFYRQSAKRRCYGALWR